MLSDDFFIKLMSNYGEKLNESIINGEDYNITYKLSVQLDNLIARYYDDKQKVVK